LAGPVFEADNKVVYQQLKLYLGGTPGEVYIMDYDPEQNGRAAWLRLCEHYNGLGEFNKRLSRANKVTKDLYYQKEESMPFETFAGTLQDAFRTLEKSDVYRLAPANKLRILLDAIKCTNPEVMATKAIVESTYGDNRPDPTNPGQYLPVDVPGATTHFGMVITRVFGDVIHNRQMIQRGKHPRSQGVYGVDSGGQNTRGRGPRGGYTGRGRGGGAGRGGRGNDYVDNFDLYNINGVDVTNPRRDFTNEEWITLRDAGALGALSRR
jgi:hypothetical protein